MIILTEITEFIIFILAVWGLFDVFPFIKFVKRKVTDKTAAGLNYQFMKWSEAQSPDLAERHPYVSLDLRETLRKRSDDKRIT